jgi:hypothetical protein
MQSSMVETAPFGRVAAHTPILGVRILTLHELARLNSFVRAVFHGIASDGDFSPSILSIADLSTDLPRHSNDAQKVMSAQSTFMLSSTVLADQSQNHRSFFSCTYGRRTHRHLPGTEQLAQRIGERPIRRTSAVSIFGHKL